MARTLSSVDEMLREAVAAAMARVAPELQRRIAAFAAEELEKTLAAKEALKLRRRDTSPRKPRPRGDALTRRVADRNARRVPKFVIETTGLDTKKKIVARFGKDAVFERGKPTPKPA